MQFTWRVFIQLDSIHQTTGHLPHTLPHDPSKPPSHRIPTFEGRLFVTNTHVHEAAAAFTEMSKAACRMGGTALLLIDFQRAFVTGYWASHFGFDQVQPIREAAQQTAKLFESGIVKSIPILSSR